MFMNRVYEQCPKIDSGKIPSRTGQKTGRVHRVHSPRPTRAPRPRACRPASPAPRTPRAPAPVAARACRPCARSRLSPQLLARPSALPAHPAARPVPACAPSTPCRAPSVLSPLSQYKILYCDTASYPIPCNTTQELSNCIATQFSCNTIPPAIQTSVLQYTSSTLQPLSHNTKFCIAI